MGRPPRLAFEGALYHLTCRGNYRRAIFRRVRDRYRFLDFFGEAVERLGWICYAYCLMRNHFHMLFETPDGNISEGMQRFNGHYSRYFNAVHGRIGHLFQGRFHTVLVEKESQLLEVCRYVVLNPVRAGLCARPEDYPWGSYRATVGLETAPRFLSVNKVLSLFGEDPLKARMAYARFVSEGRGAKPWDHLKEGRFLGSNAFVKRMKTCYSENKTCQSERDGSNHIEMPRGKIRGELVPDTKV
jgi:REP element-mobilizing transposase RayT